MIRYHGSEAVKAGFYWSPARWEIVTLNRPGSVLPGAKETLYIRLPMLLFMVVGPLMGALYVAFLPLIGFAMILGLGAVKTYGLLRTLVSSLGATEGVAGKKDE